MAAGALLIGFVLLVFGPKVLTWWQHRILISAGSHVDFGQGCQRVELTRHGEAIGIFATPPSVRISYECAGMTRAAVRALVDKALQAGGFRQDRGWTDEDYTNTGPVQASSWRGHSTDLSAIIAPGEVTLELWRD